jgi:hypothetical protein
VTIGVRHQDRIALAAGTASSETGDDGRLDDQIENIAVEHEAEQIDIHQAAENEQAFRQRRRPSRRRNGVVVQQTGQQHGVPPAARRGWRTMTRTSLSPQRQIQVWIGEWPVDPTGAARESV